MDFKIEISKILKKEIEQLEQSEIEALLAVPPEKEMGDYAFPCFKLAKVFRKAPNLIAEELASKLEKPEFLEKIENLGGYVNFYIDDYTIVKQVMDKVMTEKEDYCKGEQNNKTVIIEYSSPNIAKPFHIGHVRTTVIGNALYRLYKYLGYNTIGINHLGDYGTQFGKLIVAYKKWGNEDELQEEPIKTLLKLYVKFHEEAEKEPALEDEARAWFKKLEDKDQEATKLWEFFREESLKEFSKVYNLLDIEFDSYAGESFYSDKMPAVIEEMKEKNLLKESDGAMIVDLEDDNMPPALIQKSDGSTLYITRDLSAAIYRKNHYDFYKNIYVVGSQQILHFKQCFKILEKMGYSWYKDCIHVPFGMVALESGTIATRKGRVVFLEDVLNQSIEKTKEIIKEKNPTLENIDQLAKEIGVGAVKFQELSNSRIKDYTFSYDRTLSFEGETGPYVQYTHARACSVLKRAGEVDLSKADYKTLKDNEVALEIIKKMDTYEEALNRAKDKNEPHHIARYMLDLSKIFNKFYHENTILVEDEQVKLDRLALTKAVTYCLKSALSLYGMVAPEQM